MEQKTRREILEAALEEMSPTVGAAEAAVCTGYILVAEWSDLDGKTWMTQNGAHKQPAWRTRGLLAEALADLDRPRGD